MDHRFEFATIEDKSAGDEAIAGEMRMQDYGTMCAMLGARA